MAKDYKGQADFYVLYVREAHPGQDYSAHRSFGQELAYARAAVKVDGLNRKVLVDDLNGTMHQDYGAFPNSAYVIGKDAVIALRAEWDDPAAVKSQLHLVLAHDGNAANVKPVEITNNLVKVDNTLLGVTFATLWRAGFAALADFTFEIPKLRLAHATARPHRS